MTLGLVLNQDDIPKANLSSVSIEVKSDSFTLNLNQKFPLPISVNPTDASLSLKSENPGVVTIEDKYVVAKAIGVTKIEISAKVKEAKATKTITIEVINNITEENNSDNNNTENTKPDEPNGSKPAENINPNEPDEEVNTPESQILFSLGFKELNNGAQKSFKVYADDMLLAPTDYTYEILTPQIISIKVTMGKLYIVADGAGLAKIQITYNGNTYLICFNVVE